MNAKLILIHAILLTIAFQSLSGQSNYSRNCTDKINSGPYLSGELFIPAEPLEVITYFNSDWLLGDIYLANGEIVRNKYIKYNKLLDELFWLEPASNKIIKLDKEGILQFHFLNFQGDTSVYFKGSPQNGMLLLIPVRYSGRKYTMASYHFLSCTI
jgi:hypothetical protein